MLPHNKLPIVFAIILSFLSAYPNHAETRSFGLPETIKGTESLSIRCIAQDDRKQIWFGTEKNLYRYDGYNPTVCLDRYGNNDHFLINDIVCLDDKVLIGCVKGLVMYDCMEGTFTQMDIISGSEVFDLYKYEGYVWIGSREGLFRYDIASGTVEAVALETKVDVRSIQIVGDMIVLGTIRPAEIHIYNMADFTRHTYYPTEMFTPGVGAFDALCMTGDGRLLAGSSSALFEVGMSGEGVRTLSRFSWVKTMSDINGKILLGTDDGLFEYDMSGDTRKVSGQVLWTIFKDAENDYWYGSDTGLLSSRQNRLIRTLDVTSMASNNLYSSICCDGQGRVFAGGSYGILVFGDGTEDITPTWYKMGDPQNPLPHNKVRSIRKNPYDERIWAETSASTVRFDNSSERFRAVSRLNMMLGNAFDILFEEDCYWIASYHGLTCIKDDRIVDEVTMEDGLSNNLVIQVIKDGQGMIWLRTPDRNVYLYDPEARKLEPFSLDGKEAPKFWDLIYADGDGNLWLASGNRIFKVDPRKGRDAYVGEYYLFDQQSAETEALIEVENTIWACSKNGLFILDKDSGDVSAIASDENYQGLYYDRHTDNVYLGALDRIDVIRASDAFAWIRKAKAKPYITRITINDNEPLPASEYADGGLTLPWYRNNINVYFSDFSYRNTTPFKFNLNGDPDRWFETSGAGNHVFLPDLSPGRYTLYVSGLNDDKGEPLLSIRILRPWYASIAAFVWYSLLAALMLYLAFRLRYIRKRNKLELLQQTREIAQAKSKIDFFSDVSHEFKTPLSMIIAPASILLGETKNEKTRQSLQLIHDNAMKINSLVKMTLDYYNDAADVTDDVTLSKIELVSFARQILQAFETNFPKLDFHFHSDAEKMLLNLDVIKMEGILTNIISNACKYTPDGGSVILSLSQNRPSGLLSIRISDTGVGIPANELPLVYQRYFQSSRTKGDKKGTGLGLTIVRKYVELLGGEITATSEAPGTTFQILLPVEYAENESLAHDSSEKEEADRRMNIVIVDDNTTICNFLSGVLGEKYHCLCAHNGASGLKLCQDVKPDLIISDVVMPDMDGLEMCRQIRRSPDLSIVPIILLTAKDDKETEKKSIDLNIDAFIGKPFDIDTLVARIGQLIGKNRHMKDQLRVEMIASPEDRGEMSPDEKVLEKITRIIEENIDNSHFSVLRLCESSGFNEKYLYRKIKGLTGLSTVEYIRSIRLKKAALLLQNGNFTISEAMFMVGFTNTSYFSKAFTAQFGMTPSEYRSSFRSSENLPE